MNEEQRKEWVQAAKEQVLRNARETDQCERDLMELYSECAMQLEKEIRAFYSKYASDNQLTETEASRLLSGKEYSSFKRSLEGYLKEIETGDDSGLILELNTLAAKSRISRKEQLLSNIYRNMAHLAGRSEEGLTELLSDLVKTNFDRKMFDIQRIAGVEWKAAGIDEGMLKQILSYPWSGKQYSQTLWGNTDKLAALVRRELTLGFMSGSSVDTMTGKIDAVMDRGRYAAQRLIRTEASYFSNQGQLLAYKEAGVEKYRFLGGGCGICQRLNGGIFSIEDAKPGENLPPIHPNCKCTTVAAYDIPVFKRREGNPLKDNPKFQEWKKRQMKAEEEDHAEPGIKGKIQSFLDDRKARKDAAAILEPYADRVKVTGDVNMRNYRMAAAELERQLEKTPIKRLDQIEVFDSRDAPGRMAAARGLSLRLGTDLMNDPEHYYQGSVVNWQDRMDRILQKLRSRMQGAPSKELQQKYSAVMEQKRYSRGNVLYEGREISCVIQHEMMHIITNDKGLKGDRRLIECYNEAIQRGDIYRISYRAAANEREFLAEAGVMYENGEPLPDYIREMVREYKTYEI